LHRFVEGSLVSSNYEQPNVEAKNSKATKITSWSIRAEVVRKIDRGRTQSLIPPPRKGGKQRSRLVTKRAPLNLI